MCCKSDVEAPLHSLSLCSVSYEAAIYIVTEVIDRALSVMTRVHPRVRRGSAN